VVEFAAVTQVDPDQRPPLILFVHIPKTGGTTLANILRMNEPGERSQSLGNVFRGGDGSAKETVDFASMRRKAELESVRVLTGHVPIGVRDHLPADPELRCCTLLREPIDRTTSHFFTMRHNARRRPTRKDGLARFPEDGSLDDAIERGYLFDNLQTRMLSGIDRPFGPVNEDMLEGAKQNLEEMTMFGLAERFDESLVLAKHRLGLRSILAPPARVNPHRPRGEAVPEDMRDAARRANQYDLELYRYAGEIFDKATERDQLEFSVDLAAVRVASAEDDNGLPVPVPTDYAGDEASWNLLLRATVEALRNARDVAGVTAMIHAVLAHGDHAVDLIAKKSPEARATRWPGPAARELTELLLSRRGLSGRDEPETAQRPEAPTSDSQGSRTKADRRAARRAARKRVTQRPARPTGPHDEFSHPTGSRSVGQDPRPDS
jgi:hypothetical protein